MSTQQTERAENALIPMAETIERVLAEVQTLIAQLTEISSTDGNVGLTSLETDSPSVPPSVEEPTPMEVLLKISKNWSPDDRALGKKILQDEFDQSGPKDFEKLSNADQLAFIQRMKAETNR